MKFDGPAPDVVIQPEKVETESVTWQNGQGVTFSGQGLIAYFDTRKLPVGDLILTVVTDGKEVRYPLGAKNRANIEQPQ
jgi:hypothetical protein